MATVDRGPAGAERVSGGQLMRNVPVALVDTFLRDFDSSREAVLSDPVPIRKYIEARAADELDKWDVLIAGLKPKEGRSAKDTAGWSVIPLERKIGADDLERRVLTISGHRSRVASRGVERTGLPEDVALEAERRYRIVEKKGDDDTVNYPDRIYRAVRERPLLVLYHLTIKTENVDEDRRGLVPSEPVVAWSLSFPASARPDKKVEYILNTTKMRELFGEDDMDEDEIDGEE
jgi:hypothetical protein